MVCFAIDDTVRRLGRWTRFCGFDTVTLQSLPEGYNPESNRVLLSRSLKCLETEKRFEHYLYLESDNYIRQLKQVLETYNLFNDIQLFTRCGLCNHLLIPVTKTQIPLDAIPERTRSWVDEYWMCETCQKYYWKGSHYYSTIESLTEIGIIKST